MFNRCFLLIARPPDRYLYPTEWRASRLLRLGQPVLTIASGNPHKVREIQRMLGPLPVVVMRQPDDLDVEETGSTYLDNAKLKAEAAALRTGTWTLADDSGLEVDALGGAPGLFTARFAASNADKIAKLLKALQGDPYRSACFRSAMVLCSPQGECVDEAEGVGGEDDRVGRRAKALANRVLALQSARGSERALQKYIYLRTPWTSRNSIWAARIDSRRDTIILVYR